MQLGDLSQQIGRHVRTSRSRLGMTRKQLAAAADVSERYLHELENGDANPSVGILLKIAQALGEDFSQVLGGGSRHHSQGETSPHVGAMDHLLATMTHSEQQSAVPVIERFLAERRRNLKGIALLGLRGAGKTTLGRLLAERHGLDFISVTREIEMRAGMVLADLFNLGGPDAYRTLENDVVAEMMERREAVVLETAGGIVGNSEAMEHILRSFRTVWLKATPEEHLARVAGQGDTRPMRGNPRALDQLKALLAAREPEYARSECVLDTSRRSIDACLAELERLAEPML